MTENIEQRLKHYKDRLEQNDQEREAMNAWYESRGYNGKLGLLHLVIDHLKGVDYPILANPNSTMLKKELYGILKEVPGNYPINNVEFKRRREEDGTISPVFSFKFTSHALDEETHLELEFEAIPVSKSPDTELSLTISDDGEPTINIPEDWQITIPLKVAGYYRPVLTDMNIIWKPEIPDIPMKIKMPDGLLMLIGADP
ncbi:hypothetical protein KW795_02275, partial [Candidatus Microgenomates bacterium]|nr:hypothetical protein [Candidatus Microgenomates bacterium]